MFEIYGHDGLDSRFGAALAVLASLSLAACDVEWGGAVIALVNPAPAPEPSDESPPEQVTVEPLPSGNLMYLVRLAEGGTARAVPIARLAEGAPADLGLPSELGPEYRARFDSAFFAPGSELPLHAGGHRIGTLVLDGGTRGSGSRCPSVGTGRALLLPGDDSPEWAFAWSGGGEAAELIGYAPGEADSRMRTFGPVLAENLFRRGGENRPYLARRVTMRSVPWPGDERPAMAATYLVNDELEGDLPRGEAASLFFLARFDGRRYVPEWWEVRRYGGERGREAFLYFGGAEGPAGRIDVVTLRADGDVRLAASLDRDERRIDWTESDGCPALSLLDPAGPSAVDE